MLCIPNLCSLYVSWGDFSFHIEIIKSNDFSFYSLKKRFNYFIYTGLNISKDDEFIMKLYSQGYAFTMTNYLRKKEIDQSWGNYNEKEIKSSTKFYI